MMKKRRKTKIEWDVLMTWMVMGLFYIAFCYLVYWGFGKIIGK